MNLSRPNPITASFAKRINPFTIDLILADLTGDNMRARNFQTGRYDEIPDGAEAPRENLLRLNSYEYEAIIEAVGDAEPNQNRVLREQLTIANKRIDDLLARVVTLK